MLRARQPAAPLACQPPRESSLERDLVVDRAWRPATGATAVLVVVAAAGAGSLAAAVEQRQLAAELAQHHLGGVAVLPRLVLPLASLELALEVDLRALAQVLLGDPAEV